MDGAGRIRRCLPRRRRCICVIGEKEPISRRITGGVAEPGFGGVRWAVGSGMFRCSGGLVVSEDMPDIVVERCCVWRKTVSDRFRTEGCVDS